MKPSVPHADGTSELTGGHGTHIGFNHIRSAKRAILENSDITQLILSKPRRGKVSDGGKARRIHALCNDAKRN